MSKPKEVLHGEIVTTLTLGLARGADVEELAWDVLHELLEAGTKEIDRYSTVFLALRQVLTARDA